VAYPYVGEAGGVKASVGVELEDSSMVDGQVRVGPSEKGSLIVATVVTPDE